MLREALAWLNPHALGGFERVSVVVLVDGVEREVETISRTQDPCTYDHKIVLKLKEQ